VSLLIFNATCPDDCRDTLALRVLLYDVDAARNGILSGFSGSDTQLLLDIRLCSGFGSVVRGLIHAGDWGMEQPWQVLPGGGLSRDQHRCCSVTDFSPTTVP
jgi:hypothetical protein